MADDPEPPEPPETTPAAGSTPGQDDASYPAPAAPPATAPIPPLPAGPPTTPSLAPAPSKPAWSARRWLLLGGIAGLVVVVAVVAGVISLLHRSKGGDEAAIRTTVRQFATAVEQSDRQRIIGLLCAEEADPLLEDDPGSGAQAAGGPTEDVKVADVQVTGDTASVRVDRPNRSPAALHLRREDGVWKICASAGDQVGPGPVSPSPG